MPAVLRRLLTIAAALALAGLAGPSAAAAPARTPFQAQCEDTLDKTISVLTAQQNGYSINTQLSYKALTQMGGPGGRNSYVLGLTKTESRIQLQPAQVRILQDPVSGYECIAPQLSFSLSYKPFVIYVGSEFPPGTCGYREILAHEFRHMQAYLDHLPKVERIVRDALAKRFAGKPFYAPRGTAMSALNHEISGTWLPFIRNEMEKAELAQVAIDAPAEYLRISNACNGEIQKILKQGASRR
jgi:hypothetical protein